MFENSQLNKKLENLENVFIGSAIEKNDDGSVSNSKITDSYSNKNVSSHIYNFILDVYREPRAEKTNNQAW